MQKAFRLKSRLFMLHMNCVDDLHFTPQIAPFDFPLFLLAHRSYILYRCRVASFTMPNMKKIMIKGDMEKKIHEARKKVISLFYTLKGALKKNKISDLCS